MLNLLSFKPSSHYILSNGWSKQYITAVFWQNIIQTDISEAVVVRKHL